MEDIYLLIQNITAFFIREIYLDEAIMNIMAPAEELENQTVQVGLSPSQKIALFDSMKPLSFSRYLNFCLDILVM